MSRTFALDVASIFGALSELEKVFLGPNRDWKTLTPDQKVVFVLYANYKKMLAGLNGTKALASTDWEKLNDFLVKNHFDPMFRGPLNGIGAVSIIEVIAEWLAEGKTVSIYGEDGQNHLGFEIPAANHTALVVPNIGTASRLKTKSGDSMWILTPAEENPTPLDLLRVAFTTSYYSLHVDRLITTVHIPEADVHLKPNLDFLKGVFTTDLKGARWEIVEAHQELFLGIRRDKAWARVASGAGMRKGGVEPNEPRPLKFTKPFFVWFTQEKVPLLPIAPTYVDYPEWALMPTETITGISRSA